MRVFTNEVTANAPVNHHSTAKAPVENDGDFVVSFTDTARSSLYKVHLKTVKCFLLAVMFLMSGISNVCALVEDPSDWKWKDVIRDSDLQALNTINAHWGMPWDFNEEFEQYFSIHGLEIVGVSYSTLYDSDGNILGYELESKGHVDAMTVKSSWWIPLNVSIPQAIGNLTEMRSLILESDWDEEEGFFGNIPESIGNLTKLEYVRITGLGLTGAIPVSIVNLKKIECLILTGSFTGLIPAGIGNLINLKYLSLSGNLEARIPAEIGNLVNLEELWLTNLAEPSNLSLSGGIPPEIGKLINLERLNIINWSFGGIIPREIGNLNNLVNLSFVRCNLRGSIPPEIGRLSRLTSLVLAYNRLSGSIPEAVGNLTNLEDLQLYDNNLSGGIPEQLAGMPNLTYIALSRNDLSGELPALSVQQLAVDENCFDISEESPFLDAVELLELEGANVVYLPQKNTKISLHGVQDEAVSNLNEGFTNPDLAIDLKPVPGVLVNQPVIYSGLVADGVTPLLLQIQNTQNLSEPTDFRIRVISVSGNHIISEISDKLKLLRNGSFVSYDSSNDKITVSPSDEFSTGFAYLGAISPDFIVPSVDKQEVAVEFGVQQIDSDGKAVGQENTKMFRIRKPPTVLIHGYNTVGEWGKDFKRILLQEGPEDFVTEIRYGVANIERRQWGARRRQRR